MKNFLNTNFFSKSEKDLKRKLRISFRTPTLRNLFSVFSETLLFLAYIFNFFNIKLGYKEI